MRHCGGVVATEGFQEDEGEATDKGYANTFGVGRANMWLQAGNGHVVPLNGKDLETLQGEASR